MSATSAPRATTAAAAATTPGNSDPFPERVSPPTSPWLAALLNNPKNRDRVSRLESGLVTFMHDAHKARLQLPPCSRFQRRVCVEVAQRFRLEHRLDRPPDASDPDAVLLVLLKSPRSAIPSTMLSSLMPPIEKPVLVKRPTGRPRGNGEAAGSGAGANANAALKKVSQEEYELARARIFRAGGADVGVGAPPVTSSSTFATSTANNSSSDVGFGSGRCMGPPQSSSSSVSGPSGSSAARTQFNSNSMQQATIATGTNVCIVGGGIARGPEEGKSFARRRGRVANGTANGSRSIAPDPRVDASVAANSNVGSDGADKDDPDFDRCYDKWAVRGQAAAPPPPSQQHPPLMYGVPPPPPPAAMYSYAMHHRAISHAEAHAHAHAAAQAQAQFPLQMYHMAAAAAAAQPAPSPYFTQTNNNGNSTACATTNGTRYTASAPLAHMSGAPSYGLDDTADFPPLSAQSNVSGGAHSKHRR